MAGEFALTTILTPDHSTQANLVGQMKCWFEFAPTWFASGWRILQPWLASGSTVLQTVATVCETGF
jgi:hypothetical protein